MKMSKSHSRRQQILLLAFFALMLAQVIAPLAQAQNTGGQPAFNKAVQGQTALIWRCRRQCARWCWPVWLCGRKVG
jgi:hypothetical protein